MNDKARQYPDREKIADVIFPFRWFFSNNRDDALDLADQLLSLLTHGSIKQSGREQVVDWIDTLEGILPVDVIQGLARTKFMRGRKLTESKLSEEAIRREVAEEIFGEIESLFHCAGEDYRWRWLDEGDWQSLRHKEKK